MVRAARHLGRGLQLGAGQLGAHLRPDALQLTDERVQFTEFAPVDGHRGGAGVARRVAGAQAVHERAGLLQVEPEVLEGPDLPDQPQVALVVRAVAVLRAARVQQAA